MCYDVLREVPTSWTRLCVLQQHSPFSKVLAVGLRSTPQTTQVMKRTQKWTKCGVQVQYELDRMMFWHSCIRQVNVNTFFVAQLRAKRKLLHVWTMNIDCSWFFTSARSKFCFQICAQILVKRNVISTKSLPLRPHNFEHRCPHWNHVKPTSTYHILNRPVAFHWSHIWARSLWQINWTWVPWSVWR